MDQQFNRNKGDWKELRIKLQDIAEIFAKSLFGYEPNALPKQLIDNIWIMKE